MKAGFLTNSDKRFGLIKKTLERLSLKSNENVLFMHYIIFCCITDLKIGHY